MGKLVLTGKGRRWILNGHPWVYRDDVAGGEAEPGELVPVEDPNANVLGWALYSSSSKIAARLVTRSSAQPDRAFWAGTVARAVRARASMGYMEARGACRLLGGDADGLPGFVADRYGRTLVIQSTIQAADRMRDFLLELVAEALPFELECVVERSDSAVRKLESLEPRVEVLRGKLSELLEVEEEGLRYEVDPLGGHKTGQYLDQRENRIAAARRARGARVLDAFCYDGLFGIRAALEGAREVVCVDQSAAAGERVLRNAERNGVADRLRFERANCMQDLRRRAEAGERFELVIADPPAFARNRRELAGAERGYVELNRRALALVEPGGTLVTASCSYNVRAEQFVHFLASAARLANRDAFVEELRGAAPDHPAWLALPESAYLKCAFLRVE